MLLIDVTLTDTRLPNGQCFGIWTETRAVVSDLTGTIVLSYHGQNTLPGLALQPDSI